MQMDSRNAVRVAKAISESCQKHPLGLLRVGEGKEYGGVHANVFSSFPIRQRVVERTLAKPGKPAF